MKRRRHDSSRQHTGANDAFASELKAKIPDLARELTSSAIGNGDRLKNSRPLVGGVDLHAEDDAETQLLLKDLIKHMTER